MSAHLAARRQEAAAFKRERIERTLKKAEELYDMVLKAEHVSAAWSLAVAEKNLGLLNPKFDFSTRELRKIEMIADIYLPELSSAAVAFISNFDKCGSLVVVCMGLKDGKKPDEKAEAECRAAYEALCAATHEFKEHISRAANHE